MTTFRLFILGILILSIVGCGAPQQAQNPTRVPDVTDIPQQAQNPTQVPDVTDIPLTASPVPKPPTSLPASPTSVPNEIAYIWNRSIYLLDVQSGAKRQVTGDDTPANDVAWSPDGQRLAFTGGVEGTDIYTILPDGSGLTRITNSPDAKAFPAYAPDGTLFFIRRMMETEQPTIDIMQYADGAETVVHSQPGGLCGATGLRFGANTEFALSLSCGRGSYVLLGDIETDHTDDLAQTYLTPDDGCAYSAAWPHPERRLAVVTSAECQPNQNSNL